MIHESVGKDEIFDEVIGATITGVVGLSTGYSNVVELETTVGTLKFFHYQDCCETVELVDWEVEGLGLIGGEILSIEERTEKDKEDYYESSTWTFYTVETTTGSLWMRWMGGSNGHYSEEVYVKFTTLDENLQYTSY